MLTQICQIFRGKVTAGKDDIRGAGQQWGMVLQQTVYHFV